MKTKLYQPMDPKDATNYIYDNQYDSPRKLICTAKKLAADICAVFDQEMTVMFLEAIHNEDYVLVYRFIVQTYERLREPIPTSIRAIAGNQAYWELFLLLVSDEADEIGSIKKASRTAFKKFVPSWHEFPSRHSCCRKC